MLCQHIQNLQVDLLKLQRAVKSGQKLDTLNNDKAEFNKGRSLMLIIKLCAAFRLLNEKRVSGTVRETWHAHLSEILRTKTLKF